METIRFSNEDLEARIARVTDLEANEGGFPDSDLPGCHRKLSNILGFRPPENKYGPDGEEIMSPIGDRSSARSPIDIAEGFNLAYLDATPGNGTILHNHDTNETFVILTGRWRFWCNEDDDLHADLGPLDTISFPPGLPRRFTNISDTASDETSRMLVVIAGGQPQAVMEEDVLREARANGRFTPAAQP